MFALHADEFIRIFPKFIRIFPKFPRILSISQPTLDAHPPPFSLHFLPFRINSELIPSRKISQGFYLFLFFPISHNHHFSHTHQSKLIIFYLFHNHAQRV